MSSNARVESRRAARGEEGFALLTVLLTLIGLSALAVAGFTLSDSDYRISQNHRSGVEAFLSANAGLYEYLGQQTNGNDTVTYAYTLGSAEVTPEKLLDLNNGRALYRLTSRATYQPPEGGTATRTVSTTVIRSSGNVEIPAAILSLTGLDKNGNSGDLNGNDAASAADCAGAPADPVAGVAVPTGEYDGPSNPLDGDPPLLEDDVADLIAMINLDWDGIVNGDLIEPDYTIPTDPWPSIGPNDWPVVYAEGDLSVNPPKSGQGLLIVEGELTLNGSFSWDGVILIGDTFTSNGNNHIEGAVLSGLDVILGSTPDESDLGNGNKTYQYNSCNVAAAMEAGFSGLHEVPGTWTESM